MVFFYILRRIATSGESIDGSHGAHDVTTEMSPLHWLPVPVLIFLAFACLLLAACVAGLTLGLMSLDPLSLDIVMRSSNEKAAEAARRVKPVREQGNLLLVTLLFGNTLATELLPLVLEALVPGGYFSLIVSVVTIMLFGEIIPQAVCSRHPLITGSYMIGFVKVIRFIMYPVAFPIAYALDRLLGKELGTVYNREELKGLIEVHRSNQVLTQDETTILKGALEFSQKTVRQICTPAENVFRLDIDSKLDRDTLLNVLRSGHSRIPIYEGTPNNIVCLLLVKQLILVSPTDKLPIRALISKKKRNHKIRVAPALECEANTWISDLLNEFQKGRSHMAIVYDHISKEPDQREFVGIVSIEDIIEEILQEEIIDETDCFTDNTFTTKVLVRNAEGALVRANTISSRTVHVPGTSTAVLVKEIDVPALREPLGEGSSRDKIRPDWKKHKTRAVTSTPSPSQPLLGQPWTGEKDSTDAQTDIEKGLEESLSLRMSSQPRLGARPGQKSHMDMQYAKIPSLSSSSIRFGEDDKFMPEDFASSAANVSPLTVSAAFKGGSAELSAVRSNAGNDPTAEARSVLKMRPLPEDASDERENKIPVRGGLKRTPDTPAAFPMAYYGSTAGAGQEGCEQERSGETSGTVLE